MGIPGCFLIWQVYRLRQPDKPPVLRLSELLGLRSPMSPARIPPGLVVGRLGWLGLCATRGTFVSVSVDRERESVERRQIPSLYHGMCRRQRDPA